MNSTQNFPDSDLARHLAQRAGQFDALGGSPLELGQVLDRAGEIRRGRRMRATMAMAAVVLAVAVPTAVIAANHDTNREPTPAPPVKIDRSPLTLQGLEEGAPPRIGYVLDNTWHADGKSTELATSGSVRGVARVGSRLLVQTDTEDGPLRATVVPTPPDFAGQTSSWPIEGGFAVSGNGELAAFVQPDGTPVIVQDDGRVSVDLPPIPRGSGFGAVDVVGEDCKKTGGDTGCTVWVNTRGSNPEVWMSTTNMATTNPRPEMMSVDDVFGNQVVAGMISATDDGSCSAVGPVDGPAAWSTCDHQFGSFSPDGEHLSAFPAYFDGAGSSELAVLDARTGAVVLDLHTTQDAYVSQVVWEDHTHLLAVLGEGRRAAVLRIGLDGSREYAVPPTAGEPYVSPFVLPTD